MANEETNQIEELDDLMSEEDVAELIEKWAPQRIPIPIVYIRQGHIYFNTFATKILEAFKSVKYEVSKNYIFMTFYEKPNMYGTFSIWHWSRSGCVVTSFPKAMEYMKIPTGARKLYKYKDKYVIKRDELFDMEEAT